MRSRVYALLILIVCGGCSVERTITVNTNPPGALVFLNDQEIGRTPVTHNFRWYGVYDVEVRKEGYQTLKTRGKVIAPWWQWVPFDFVAELTPGHHIDRHELAYSLEAAPDEPSDAQVMVARGQQLESRLESGERTHPPDTQPDDSSPKKRRRPAGKKSPSSAGPASGPVDTITPGVPGNTQQDDAGGATTLPAPAPGPGPTLKGLPPGASPADGAPGPNE